MKNYDPNRIIKKSNLRTRRFRSTQKVTIQNDAEMKTKHAKHLRIFQVDPKLHLES